MSLRKTLTAAVAGLALTAASVGPFTAAAYADSFRGKGSQHGQYYNGKGSQNGYQYSRKGSPKYRYDSHYRRDRSDNVGKGIAIGLGVLLLGSILANAHN